MRRRSLALGVVGLLLFSCSEASEISNQTVAVDDIALSGGTDLGGDGSADGAADGAADDVQLADASPETGPPTPLLPCSSNDDCDSGWCVASANGHVCTNACDSACPPGWSCQQLTVPGADPVFLCLDDAVNLCRPCSADIECRSGSGDPNARCVELSPAEGSFCGVDCAQRACPIGYTCVGLTDPVSGVDYEQCLPDAGACDCNGLAVLDGAQTGCYDGLCAGVRGCTVDGLSACDAQASTPETCNGLDDDCNGVTDDSFLVGGFYTHPEHCGSCGENCVGRFANGEGTCGNLDGVPTCVVSGCHDGYEKVQPDLCAPTGEGQCQACTSDAGCPAWLTCTPLGSASFCVEPCTPDVTVCSPGYACAAVGDGHTCLLAAGGCAGEGTPCETEATCVDLNPCTVGACLESACTFGPSDCDDDNACTTDGCAPAGGCTHVPLADETPCDADSDGCTAGDSCMAGSCVAGDAPDCGDALDCTEDGCTSDGADAYTCTSTVSAGSCLIANSCVAHDTSNPANPCQRCDSTSPQAWTSHADGLPCDADANPCTVGDACEAGACAAGADSPCSDAFACTDDVCSPTGDSGFECQYPVTDGLCLIDGQCYAAGAASPASPCLICTPSASSTAWTAGVDGAACSDGDPCTLGDVCDAGGCLAGAPADCNDDLDCTSDSCQGAADGYVCIHDVVEGRCLVGGACYQDEAVAPGNSCLRCAAETSQTGWSNAQDTSPCDADGDGCTQGDSCHSGSCIAGPEADCADPLDCTVDTCNNDGAHAYSCEHTLLPGTCLIGGTCRAPDELNPINACQRCLAGTSQQQWSNQTDGAPCDADGDLCTTGDSCDNGTCSAGTGSPCVDAYACTTDLCVPVTAGGGAAGFDCQYPVNDGWCLIEGQCLAAGAEHPMSPCLVCQPALSKTTWSNAANTVACDDGDPCSEDDRCSDGTCAGGGAPDCADGLACTTDSCVVVGDLFSCVHTTDPGTCLIGGTCFEDGASLVDIPCRVCAASEDQEGWSDAPSNTACNADDTGCTANDTCAAGLCLAGAPATCSDPYACTSNQCVADGPNGFTCQFPVIPAACLIDGACRTPGESQGPCLECSPVTSQTVWTPKVASCDDGDPCTDNDACDNGSCVGTDATECTPGAVDSEPCGLCGTRSRQCSDSCGWGGWSACSSEGVCAPGTIQDDDAACGDCGTQSRQRQCNDTCQWAPWSSWSSCGSQGVCTPGEDQTDTGGCGNCGSRTRVRTCTNACSWGSYGSWSTCGGQGICSPGTQQTQNGSCGNCGSRSRVRACTDSCSWGSYGAWTTCANQGVCAVGTWDVAGCGECAARQCSGSCQWGTCGVAPGNQCLPQTWRYCGNMVSQWQWCDPVDASATHCMWFPCDDIP